MNAPARTITVALALLGAGALFSPAIAQDSEDSALLLVSRSNEEVISAGTDRVRSSVTATEYGLPGTPTIIESRAEWRPRQDLAVHADISTATYAPCSADVDEDCRWSLPDNRDEAVGFSVGASWQPLNSLQFDVGYASRPALGSDLTLSPQVAAFGPKEDLTLSCKLDTLAWGDLELGLKLSRWNDLAGDVEGPDASAALGVAWELGAFRGDVTSRYVDLVGGRSAEGGWSTFDISFAWRTPWNARLSVGARNLLNEPAPDAAINEGRIEDFLGRVPYVRYQQDL
ncbi:MAG: TonB-dependent receptor [Pseudomonadota bacterium]